MTPIKRGTARRLGLRPPNSPYGLFQLIDETHHWHLEDWQKQVVLETWRIRQSPTYRYARGR